MTSETTIVSSHWKNYSVRPTNELRLNPRYGAKVWDATRTCEDVHPHGPIPIGSHDYCESCGMTGVEGHNVLRRAAMDRNGNATWPDPQPPIAYDPSDLAGGTGQKSAKRPRPSERDREWLAAHRGGVSLQILATTASVKPEAVTEGMYRAIDEERRAIAAAVRAEQEREANDRETRSKEQASLLGVQTDE